MEYVQERIATFHDYGSARPSAPVDQAAVVVPLAQRDQGSPAATRVMRTLSTVDPDRVLVALRAEEGAVAEVVEWIDSFDVDATVLWCTAPALRRALGDADINGTAGKGRDVWLALGVASDAPYVVVHDADALSYDASHVPKLLAPLDTDYAFSKGYYARIESERFYGRLFRLFFRPLVRALSRDRCEEFLSYLESFRYALAGEFAMTSDLARSVRLPRGWGLEIGTLGDTFDIAGFDGTAQVDLGVHEHEHRSVEGAGGLGTMATDVGETLFTVLEERGIDPDYDELRRRYREAADRLVSQYAGDASFNGLEYDVAREREQVETYAQSVRPPENDDRLPSWESAPIEPATVRDLSADAIASHR